MPTTPFRVTDEATLKALAHPIRQRLLWELGARQSARAADLAVALTVPANSVSFHLRTLARAGLIEEAPELSTDKRDRVWRLSHPEGLEFSSDDSQLTADIYLTDQLDWIRDLLRDRLDEAPNAVRASTTSAALLTHDEALELVGTVKDLIASYRKRGMHSAARDGEDDDDDGGERVYHQISFFIGNR